MRNISGNLIVRSGCSCQTLESVPRQSIATIGHHYGRRLIRICRALRPDATSSVSRAERSPLLHLSDDERYIDGIRRGVRRD